MGVDVQRRIDELELELQAFARELHEIRRLAASAQPMPSRVEQQAPMPTPSPPATTPPSPMPAATMPRAKRAVAAPPTRTAPPPPPRRARRARPTVGELVERLDLFGPRGLAVAGGVVTLLGIVFFFVLATNRGWIGPSERVALGAAASMLTFLAGVVVHYRFGQLHAALAAVGTGIAGGYATLAAATVLYGLVPAPAALPCAAGIAAAGLAVALLWSSELLAALGLLGAALSPAALALDEGVSAAGTAFALVVLGAIAAVTVRRSWTTLLVAGVAVTLPQVAWTVAAADAGDAGATAVAASCALVLFATSAAWQWAHGRAALDVVAAGLAATGVGVALSSTVALYPDGHDRAIALFAYAAALAGACALVAPPMRELAYVLGTGALTLAGVSCAELLTGASLAVVFAAQSIVAIVVAHRLRERRFQLGALAYLGLAVWQAFVAQDAFARGDGSAAAAAGGLAACAVATLGVGLLAPSHARRSRPEGILGSLEPLLDGMGRYRVTLRAWLACLAFGVLALAIDDLLSGPWLTVAFAAGSMVAALAAWRLEELRLVPFGLASTVLAAAHALVDVPLLPDLYPRLSAGTGATVALGSAAMSAAISALLLPRRQRGIAWIGALADLELRLDTLRVERRSVGSILAGLAVVLGLGTTALALAAAFGNAGHGVAIVLWSAVGLSAVGLATPRGRFAVVVAANLLLVATLAKAALYDWPELGADQGALETLVASAAILLAGWMLRAFSSTAARVTIVSAAAAAVALVSSTAAIDQLVDPDRLAGVGMLGIAAVYALLAALAHRHDRLRNLSTAMWVPGMLALLRAEALVLQGRTIVVAYAVTATGLAWLGRRIDERRLVGAALALLGTTTLVALLALTPPTHLLEASAAPGASAWALSACAAAAAAVGLLLAGTRGRQLGWIAGGLGVYIASLAILELAQRVSTASVQTDFERGHTAVSALWGAIGLGLLLTGLLRRARALRLGGLALFGISLAKLFLYDLSTLSSVTRAFSFIAVGALPLTGGFFLQRLGSRFDESSKPRATTV
jgi:Predicted membrane protein (DUF2339)